MKIILTNQKEFETTESSTIEQITILVDTYSMIDKLVKEFSRDNLKRVTLNDIVFERVVPLKVLTENVGEKIAVTFINRKETFEEKILIQLGDLQETVLALSEGGNE